MKSIELYTTRIFIEGYPESRQANYKYVLVESEKEIEYLEQQIVIPCFGIEIIREDIEKDSVRSIERDRIECMTPSRYKAIQLIKKLYENCVSPIHLLEIAGPFADEWVEDFDQVSSNILAQ